MKRVATEQDLATTEKKTSSPCSALAAINSYDISDEEDYFEDANSTCRLGKCEVCAKQDARYSCPRCEVKTCCLSCVQIHKKELNCSGIRDPVKFIPLRQMTEADFMRDYRFMEDCCRYTENRKTDRIKSYTRYNKHLPAFLHRLRSAAAKRDCKLRFLLQNFSRHKENTTRFDIALRKIFWRVEWIFVNAGNLIYIDEYCDENEPLQSLLHKYLNPESQNKHLEFYQSAGVFALKILLKAEGIKRCRNRFYALNAAKSLKENFRFKTIVEYPSIYLSYEKDLHGFDIIDSDEDVEAETEKHEELFKKLHEKQKEADLKSQNSSEDSSSETEAAKPAPALAQEPVKHEKLSNLSSNFLFSDEAFLNEISSSSDDEAVLANKDK